jgi:hypothetical protein
MESTVPYDPNWKPKTAITQKGKTSLSLVPNWVWYVSIPIALIGLGSIVLKNRR